MNTSQVKELNERIENIRTQRTKADTKREMLLSTLKKQLEEYEKLYGVRLGGKSFKSIVSAVGTEKEKVENSIREEYELKLKVVEAIESGDIDMANSLLGITSNTDDEEDAEEEVIEETSSNNDTDLLPEDDDLDEDWNLEVVDEPEKPISPNVSGASTVDDMVDELDGVTVEDDDDDFGFGDILAGSKFDI